MLIVGESINGTIPKIGEAIQSRDVAFIQKLAQEQVQAGAQMLDVNAGVAGENEVDNLVWLVKIVQEIVEVPLMLDSADPEALRAALMVHKGRPIINSISAEKHKLDTLLPLVAGQDCGVVALCLGDQGIPQTPEARLEVAQTVVGRATALGVKPEDIYVDPLTLALSTDQKAAQTSLTTLRLIHEHLPQVRAICVLSNVSFGMPKRRLLNRTFLSMFLAIGVDAVLIDVRDKEMMATLTAANALLGNDPYCRAYLKAYRAGKLGI